VAISDCGYAFTAQLRYDEEGSLVGLDEPRLFPLLGLGGRPLGRGDVDAEALVADGTSYVASFEGRHHLWRYPADPPLEGTPVPVPAPLGLASCGSNQGVEAAVRLDDGRYLLISEGPSPARSAPAWIGSGDTWTTLAWPLFFADDSPGPFHATGAAILPGGDVLVVERRYPPLAARLRRVPAEALVRGDLTGTEVARLAPPQNVDNFEAVDVLSGPRGETRVLLVSDDNDCVKRGSVRTGLQRTLVLLFDLGG
ncbi:MAG TPA: esterase-like activity of phytase family protein, partial [Vicinamibacteria bacterium]